MNRRQLLLRLLQFSYAPNACTIGLQNLWNVTHWALQLTASILGIVYRKHGHITGMTLIKWQY